MTHLPFKRLTSIDDGYYMYYIPYQLHDGGLGRRIYWFSIKDDMVVCDKTIKRTADTNWKVNESTNTNDPYHRSAFASTPEQAVIFELDEGEYMMENIHLL